MFALIYNHFMTISEPRGVFLVRECCTVPGECIAWQSVLLLRLAMQSAGVHGRFFLCRVTEVCERIMELFWISAQLNLAIDFTLYPHPKPTTFFGLIQPLRHNKLNGSKL